MHKETLCRLQRVFCLVGLIHGDIGRSAGITKPQERVVSRKKKAPKVLTMDAIKALHPDKWIVVQITKSDGGGSPTHGKVPSVHNDRAAAYDALVVSTGQVVEYGDSPDEEECINIVCLSLEGTRV